MAWVVSCPLRVTVPAMACRGYFLALDDRCVALVLAQDGDDGRLIEVVKELDMTGAPDACGVDKAWDGIHRCLTEGELGGEDGMYPLNAVVLGGLSLHVGGGYVVSFTRRLRFVRSPLRSLASTSRPSSSGTGRWVRRSTAPRSIRTVWTT